jgi:hypothetical protein
MIFILVAAAVVVAVPIVAAVLVTVASLREDSARSLAGRPPGPATAAARRLLCLHTISDIDPRRPASPTAADQPPWHHAYAQIPRARAEADAEPTLTLPRS